jgi:hypothetical protein
VKRRDWYLQVAAISKQIELKKLQWVPFPFSFLMLTSSFFSSDCLKMVVIQLLSKQFGTNTTGCSRFLPSQGYFYRMSLVDKLSSLPKEKAINSTENWL